MDSENIIQISELLDKEVTIQNQDLSERLKQMMAHLVVCTECRSLYERWMATTLAHIEGGANNV